jgi:ABC-type multidrug transport system ATPase subunit
MYQPVRQEEEDEEKGDLKDIELQGTSKKEEEEDLKNEYRYIPKIGICCRSLYYSVNHGQKRLLQGITFHARPGKLTAIMGTTGCGKSTLVQVLAGKIPDLNGICWYNDLESETTQSQADALSRHFLLSCVLQDPFYCPNLTVHETLEFSASSSTTQNIDKRVKSIERLLMLSQVKDMFPSLKKGGRLSGGQRRLLEIGKSIAVLPSILLVDEPTTGLDSSTALSVMEQLKRIAQLGCTVVVVLHQPSMEIFQLIDNLILLGKEGLQFYSGEASKALERVCQTLDVPLPLSKKNEADLLFKVIKQKEGELKVCPPHERGCDQTIHSNRLVKPRPSPSIHLGRQVKLLFQRECLQNIRDWRLIFLVWAINCSLSIVLSSLFSNVDPLDQARRNFHYMLAASSVTFMVARIFPRTDERKLYDQEVSNGHYSPLAYVLALALACIPFLFLVVLSSTLFQYLLVSNMWLDAKGALLYVVAYLDVLYCTEAFLSFWSFFFKSHAGMAIAITGCLLCFGSVLMGLLIRPSQMSSLFFFLHKISFQTMHFQVILSNDSSGRPYTNITTLCSLQPIFVNGQDILRDMEISNIDILFNLLMILLMSFVLWGLAYVVLRIQKHSSSL